MLRVLHTIFAYSSNIGAKRDTCQTGVENTSVQLCTKMGNAPNWHRAKLKRAKLGPRQNETRQTGTRQTDARQTGMTPFHCPPEPGVNSAPEWEFLANSKSKSGLGMELA